MTAPARWRIVQDPVGRASVLSDRTPGPVMGARGGLHGWQEAAADGTLWLTFEQACLASAVVNGKPSTAAMVAGAGDDLDRSGAS